MSTDALLQTKQVALPIQFNSHNDTNQTITLRDGRKLGFAQYGDPTGAPVFFFHGGAGSRLERPANQSALGIRLITTDRPGHGLSDFHQGRNLLDWPDDVLQLADHLGVNKFYVLGWSAGGPHALACAYLFPERVLAGGVAASPAPMNRSDAARGQQLPGRAFIFTAQHFPGLVGQFRKIARNAILGDTDKAKQQLMAAIPEEEKEFMGTSGNLDMLYHDVCEGYRTGWRGAAHDDAIIFQDWGFDIADIRVRIDIWHGDQDRNVPYHSGEYMHHRISNSQANFLSGEGHMFLLRHWGNVLQTLVSE
jgi:pimeloyl-ACP methyl ester carboxylesterase